MYREKNIKGKDFRTKSTKAAKEGLGDDEA